MVLSQIAQAELPALCVWAVCLSNSLYLRSVSEGKRALCMLSPKTAESVLLLAACCH